MHAPHPPSPQPNLVPVFPESLKYCNKVISGSTRVNSTLRPFKKKIKESLMIKVVPARDKKKKEIVIKNFPKDNKKTKKTSKINLNIIFIQWESFH